MTQHSTSDQPSETYQQPVAAGIPTDTGQVLSIIGLVMVMWFAPIGLILSIISYRKLKQADQPTLIGTIGIWVNAVASVITLAFLGLWLVLFSGVFMHSFLRL